MDSSIDLTYEKKCFDDIKNQILQITYGEKGDIFLFGARAKGTFHCGSDIDIGIDGMKDDIFENIKFQINLYWDNCFVPYHIDLVNFNHVREDFRKVAMEKVKLWKKL